MSEPQPLAAAQLSLFLEPTPSAALQQAVQRLAEADRDERGAIFTRREVVDFILDLTGYSLNRPLHQCRLLEPSFGAGDFLLPAIERLLASLPDEARTLDVLAPCVRGVEIHAVTFERTRQQLIGLLLKNGFDGELAASLAATWLVQGDFLLESLPHTFTHIVGNPPYVRQELIPDVLLKEYKSRYKTIYDRADLYIPFIERCLSLLERHGALGFICADRWTKNKYGGPLRELIAEKFKLAYYINMVEAPAFHNEVSAYPAIFVITNEKAGPTLVVAESPNDLTQLKKIKDDLLNGQSPSQAQSIAHITKGSAPWIMKASTEIDLLRRLENDFPLLEEAGCKVGIGVATGADRVFIAPYESLEVESQRKLPLVKTKDIEAGKVSWRGLAVLNPFEEDGTLADLAQYPLFAAYIHKHEAVIRRRNCAKNNARGWYRTIDRIYPQLAKTPKLLIPDIKGGAHIVHEHGRYYPHHNLYYVTATDWELPALRVILSSPIVEFFVKSYSTQMRGGYFRFQAQYLRRIRLPHWISLSMETREQLLDAAPNDESFEIIATLYNLSAKEKQIFNKLIIK